MTSVYLIGSLRNPEIPVIANRLREHGFDVFDDWYYCGPEADDYWKTAEQGRGRTFEEALDGWQAQHIYEFDKYHLERCDIAVLVMKAGKSAHLELGYAAGIGKYTVICIEDDTDRWDVMYKFANKVVRGSDQLVSHISRLIGT